MNASKYFRELTLNLHREGFTVGPEADGLLPVSLDGKHLCTAPERGGVRYRKEDVDTEAQTAALDKVIDITRTTSEYMRQMEAAPFLKASDLSEKFEMLTQKLLCLFLACGGRTRTGFAGTRSLRGYRW